MKLSSREGAGAEKGPLLADSTQGDLRWTRDAGSIAAQPDFIAGKYYHKVERRRPYALRAVGGKEMIGHAESISTISLRPRDVCPTFRKLAKSSSVPPCSSQSPETIAPMIIPT